MVEPDAHNITQRKGRGQASLVGLQSDETYWALKFSDIIRIGVLHLDLRWYVATVYAIKLRHNKFLATRAIHSFIPFFSKCYSLPDGARTARPSAAFG
jgi:hypothetical protein